MKNKWIAAATMIFNSLCFGQSGAGSERAKDTSVQIKEISTTELKAWLSGSQNFTLIDVREDSEWQAGHAAAAMHIARGKLSDRVASIVPDKDARIVLYYCLGGVRSAAAAVTLQKMGYAHVYSLSGGFKQYQLAALPVLK